MDSDFNVEDFIIIIENIFIIKNLTDIRKTVETGLDPHLCVVFCRHVHLLFCSFTKTYNNSCDTVLPIFLRQVNWCSVICTFKRRT